ncbi:MAG TPA: SDR family NAD(P)-dependent oxidoreductase, partial [Flavitalea sp.]|nr:SDR family NAD(P)-dependent oxidoreductase [Flavitalea sp.]
HLTSIVKELEQKTGKPLYPTLLFEYSSIKELTRYIVDNHGDTYTFSDQVAGREEKISEYPHIGAQEGYSAAKYSEREVLTANLASPDISDSTALLYYNSTWENSPKGEQEFETLSALSGSAILIFDSDYALRSIINKRFEEDVVTGARVIGVRLGKHFQKVGTDLYEINAKEAEDYKELIQLLHEQNSFPVKIIYAWAKHDTLAELTVDNCLENGIYSLSYLSKALLQYQLTSPIHLLYLIPALHTMADPLPWPALAGLLGFNKTVVSEHPKLIYSTIEVNDPFLVPGIILEEFSKATSTGTSIKYESRQRYLRSLQKFTGNTTNSKSQLKEGGVYLITGGAGGLGLLFATHLATQFKAKIALSGRSVLSSQQIAILEKLKKNSGADILYIQADISCDDDVKSLWQTVKQHFKLVNGVIHAAGVNHDNYIINKKQNEIETVAAPKVQGTILLDAVSQNEPLDFFVLFSSVSAVFGNAGQSDYAFANSFMDHYAQVREQMRAKKKRFGKTVSINWPLWREGGMQISEEMASLILKNTGIRLLSTENGIQAFEDALRSAQTSFIVLEGQATRIDQFLNPEIKSDKFKANITPIESSIPSVVIKDPTSESLLIESVAQPQRDWPRDEIAIIGVSGRYPMAKNIDEFWENLKNGKDCITEIPPERWNNSLYHHSDKSKKGKTYCKWGGFIDDVDKFDPFLFNITPKDAELMDPQERLFMEVSWEAIEDAGYTKANLRD